MTPVNDLLTALRDFLYDEEPDERKRESIYGMLERHMEHQAIWLPLFQSHARWAHEPLVWSHVEGMEGGSLRCDVHGPWSVEMEAYDRVFPGGPLKLLLRGGSQTYLDAITAPGALVRRCVHLCIDHPEWSCDEGQSQCSGSANILEILDGALQGLKGQLRALHTFTFEAARHSRYKNSDMDEEEQARFIQQTTLLPPDIYRRARGFDRLKKLLASSRQLRQLTLSNKTALSKYNPKTGKAMPYCIWLPRCSWWPQLESLDLHENQLQDGDLRWLFRNPMPALVELSLRGNRLTDGAVEALLREGFFPALERLELRDNPISPEGTQALRESPRLPRLKTLLV